MKKASAVIMAIAAAACAGYWAFTGARPVSPEDENARIGALLEEFDKDADGGAYMRYLLRMVEIGDIYGVYLLLDNAKTDPGTKAETEKLLARWKSGAKKGDPDALCNLGLYYFSDTSPEQNISEGIRLLKEAAEKGSVLACRTLSGIYRDRYLREYDADPKIRPPQDSKLSFLYTQKAAELGSVISKAELAYCHFEGSGTPQNKGKAAELLREFCAEAAPLMKYRNIYSYDYLYANMRDAALMFANGTFGEDLKPEGAQMLDRICGQVLNGSEISQYADFYIICLSDNYAKPDPGKARKLFDSYADKVALARQILETWKRGFFLGNIFNTVSLKIEFPESEAQKLADYIAEGKDPYTRLEKKYGEVFGQKLRLESGIFGSLQGNAHTEKLERIRPYLEDVLKNNKNSIVESYLDRLSIDLLAIYARTRDYEKIGLWLDKYADGKKWFKAMFVPALSILAEEDREFASKLPRLKALIKEFKDANPAEFYSDRGQTYLWGNMFGIKRNQAKAEENLIKSLELKDGMEVRNMLLRLYGDDPEKFAQMLVRLKGPLPESLDAREALKLAEFRLKEGKAEEAFALFLRAANCGAAKAYGILHYMYLKGIGTKKDAAKAEAWRKKILESDKEKMGDALQDLVFGVESLCAPALPDYGPAIVLGKEIMDAGGAFAGYSLSYAYEQSMLPNKYALMIEALEKEAERGGTPFCYSRLADIYGPFGPDEFRDLKKSAFFLRKYADSENANIGEDEKLRVLERYAEAGEFEDAAKYAQKLEDSATAMMFAARAYREGRGVPKDPAKADECEALAMKCLPESVARMGEYLYGGGPLFPKDREKALAAMEKLYESGYKSEALGSFFLHAKGNAEYAARGVAMLEDLAKYDASAYLHLRNFFMDKKDYPKAFEYAKKLSLSDMGHTEGHICLELGGMYMNGLGTPKDEKKAFECFERAYKTRSMYGSYVAAEAMAYCLENGIGTKRDPKKAEELRAPLKNDPHGMTQLGRMYTPGSQIYDDILPETDPERARYWYRLAADAGGKDARMELEKLDRKFPPLSKKELESVKILDLNKRIAKGDDEAETELAIIYIEGRGAEKNLAAGIMRLKSAATKGNVRAAENIKRLFYKWKSESGGSATAKETR